MRINDTIQALIEEAWRVYRIDGPAMLCAKTARKVISPVLGDDWGSLAYYNINRLFNSKPIFESESEFKNLAVRLNSDIYEIFFGFYDHTPFGPDNQRVLFNRTKTPVRPLNGGEILELCYYNINNENVNKFGETSTWNWQKGCRLHWLPGSDNLVIYNKLVNNKYGSVIQNVETGIIERRIPHAIYDIGPEGKRAVSVNFSRLERLHPDYGYVTFEDETAGESAPTDDGIYIVNLESNDRELLLSYDKIVKITDSPSDLHHYVMNLMINPAGDRCCFLHRYHEEGDRITNMLCVHLDSKEVQILQTTDEASHPTWRTDTELLCTVNKIENGEKKTDLILYQIDREKKSIISHPQIDFDTHPSFSPMDRMLMIGDSYPDRYGERILFLTDLRTKEFALLGRSYAPNMNGVKRDYHPRCDRNGEFICIDVPAKNNTRELGILQVNHNLTGK